MGQLPALLMRKYFALLTIIILTVGFAMMSCKKEKVNQNSSSQTLILGSWKVSEGYYNTVAEHKTPPVWVYETEYEGMVIYFAENGTGSWGGDPITWTTNTDMTRLSIKYPEVIYDYDMSISADGKQMCLEGYYFKLKLKK